MPSSERPGGPPPSPPLKADFEFAPACPTEGSTVQFWDRSAGNPASWTWKIDGEDISSSPSATHDFRAAGVYAVSVTVTKDDRSDTATKTVRVANQVITFYSYKGGTGRSMALANIGCLLADRKDLPRLHPESGLLELRDHPTAPGDKGVLLVDWDLEAPGLHRFFRDQIKQTLPPGQSVDEVIDAKPGLIDLFLEIESALRKKSPAAPASEPPASSASDDPVREALDRIELDSFVMETGVPSLRLLKAGRFDDGYSRRVNTFQWEGLYKDYPGIIRAFADRLTKEYRYVLIDSRTGLTDISGICTMLMPEKLVVVFTPNRQSLTGVIDLVRRASTYRRGSDDLRPLLVFPLPSRIEAARPTLRETWRSGDADRDILGYQPQFEKLFQEVYQLSGCELSEYFDEVQIQQVPDYAYGEEIAVRIEGRRDRLSLTRSYSAFAERLVDSPAPWVAPPVAVASSSLPPPEARLTPLEAVRIQSVAAASAKEALPQAEARVGRGWLLPAAAVLLAVAGISVFVLKRPMAPVGVNAHPGSVSPQTPSLAIVPTAPPTRDTGVPAHQLASRAMALLGVGNQVPEVPLLLSVEAHRKSDTFETRSALFAAIEALPGFRGVEIRDMAGDVLALNFPIGGRTLLAVGVRQGLLWNVGSQTVLWKSDVAASGAKRATVSADGTTLAVAVARGVAVSKIGTLEVSLLAGKRVDLNSDVRPLHEEVLGLGLSKDGDVLAVANGDGSVTLWDNSGGSKGKLVVDRAGSEFTIAISPDGKILASGGTDGKITLWDLVHLQPLGPPMGGPASAAEAHHPPSPVGEEVLVTVRTVHQRTSRLVLTGERASSPQQRRQAYQTSVPGSMPPPEFPPERTTQQLRMPDLRKHSLNDAIVILSRYRRKPQVEQGPSELPRGLVYYQEPPPGTDLAIVRQIVLHVSEGSKPPQDRTAFTSPRMAFSPDGRLLAASSADNSILVWDIAKRTSGSPLIGHRTAVTTIAFAPDGRLLASGSEYGTLILWDLPAYQPLGQSLRSGKTATGAVAFSPDGKYLAASSGQSVTLWDVTLSDDRACDAAKRNLTAAEWQSYLGTEPYRQTCPTFPSFGK